jgi:prepilin-type N-terminal cleavage/methylation domain-containing protein
MENNQEQNGAIIAGYQHAFRVLQNGKSKLIRECETRNLPVLSGGKRRNGRNSGFTMIELLLVIAIMAGIFSAGIVNYRDFSRRQQLQSASRMIKADLRLTQERALAQEKPAGCQTLYGFRFSRLASNRYSVARTCINSGTMVTTNIKIVDLSSDFSINSFTPSPIYFLLLGKGTNIPTGAVQPIIVITQLSTGNTTGITVTSTGEIN